MQGLPVQIDARAMTEPGVAFTLRLGEALHRYGVPAHRIEQALALVATRYGLEGRFYSTPTAIIASFGPPEALRSCMIRVEPGEIDLSRLAELDELTTRVIRQGCPADEASERLEAILARPPLYGRAATVVASMVASTGAAFLLGGTVREMVVALVISLSIGLLALLAGRTPPMMRMWEGIGALLATVIAIAGQRVLGPYAVELAVVAGIIVLLPGLSITVAFTELATRNLVSGTSRAMAALVVFLLMGFGVALGTTIDGVLPPIPPIPPAPRPPRALLPLVLVLGVGSFAVTWRARPRDTGWIVLGGSLAYFAAGIGSRFLGPQLGAFVGSLALCVGSNLLARLRNRPSLITILPGILLLVPGSIGFRSLDALLGNDVLTGMEIAFHMALVAMGIVMGLLLANVLVPPRKVL